MGESGVEREAHVVTLSAEAVSSVEELMGQTPGELADRLVASAQEYCVPGGDGPCKMQVGLTLTPEVHTVGADFDPASARLLEGGKQILAFSCQQCGGGLPETTAGMFTAAMEEAQPEWIRLNAVEKVERYLSYK